MAYLTNTICQECGEDFMGDTLRGIGTCRACLKIAADENKLAHFAILDKMTIEERIRELEEESYRRANAKPVYVPPPLIGGKA